MRTLATPAMAASVLLLTTSGCRQEAEAPTAFMETAVAPSFRQVSAGAAHTCGVATDDRAYCWGQNQFGKLGAGSSVRYSQTPVAVAGGLSFGRVSAGGAHTCGVTRDNEAYCWGDGITGALGVGGSVEYKGVPTAVAGGLRFRHVSAGRAHSCGVTTDDLAYCWGNNFSGELGDGTMERAFAPMPVAGGLRFVQVTAGSSFSCGVTDDEKVYCWGSNANGQLGDGTTATRLTPVVAGGGRRFLQVNASERHACAVNPFNRAFCWGDNSSGQLGDGTVTQRLVPTRVAGGLTFARVDPGLQSTTCGVTLANRAYCWGANYEGQIGDGTQIPRPIPVRVLRNLSFQRVEPGGDHTCGATTDSQGYCWGSNAFGKLGDGTFKRRLRPMLVAGVAE